MPQPWMDRKYRIDVYKSGTETAVRVTDMETGKITEIPNSCWENTHIGFCGDDCIGHFRRDVQPVEYDPETATKVDYGP